MTPDVRPVASGRGEGLSTQSDELHDESLLPQIFVALDDDADEVPARSLAEGT